jgi:hypothetical protein
LMESIITVQDPLVEEYCLASHDELPVLAVPELRITFLNDSLIR